jgi:hypothetical protein
VADKSTDNPTKEALYELLNSLERLETQCDAMMACLRAEGVMTDEKLAPFLEQASKASDVRSRALHARLDHLLDTEDTVKPAAEANPQQPNERPTEGPKPAEASSTKPADKSEPESSSKTADQPQPKSEDKLSPEPAKKPEQKPAEESATKPPDKPEPESKAA